VKKKYFWNSVWQVEQAKKGAKKGGSQNTLKQLEARKRTGETLGKKLNGHLRGLENQTQQTCQALQYSYLWSHKKYGTFLTLPQQAVIDLANQCFSVPIFKNSLPITAENRKVSRELGRLIRLERKTYHGWFIEPKDACF
jgi:hypothetical protein